MAAWRADNPADGSTTRCGVTPRVNSLRIGDFLMSILGSLPGFSHVRTAQTALAVALIVLGVSSCDPGDSRSVSGTSPAASRTAPQSPDANPIPEASRIPEKKADAEADPTRPVEGDGAQADSKETANEGNKEVTNRGPIDRFTEPDRSGLQGELQGRAGADPFLNGEAPSATGGSKPGAVFGKELYVKIASLPNSDFITLRTKIMNDTDKNPVTVALQRSFFSNGCTGVPQGLTPERAWKACAQHDFRYTVGPNVLKNDEKALDADRTNADAQLGTNIGVPLGKLAEGFVNFFGKSFYTATDSAGDEKTTNDVIRKHGVSLSL